MKEEEMKINDANEAENSNDSEEEDKDERAEWTADQDTFLKTLVNTHGPHNWVIISEGMNAHFQDKHKSSKQCRERWCNKLDPVINHSPWTKQEEATLILAHMTFKNRWCDIASALRGRHNNMIKNRFYSIFRKVKNKIKNSDFSYTSKLELIEMYYMISVMEEYAANPPPPDEPKRKRGKDFMYTLIEDLNLPILTKYKLTLVKKYPVKAPLGNLLNEIIQPTIHTPDKNVSQINMAFGEPMDMVEDRLPRSATPGTCPAKLNLTLPQPKQFFSKEPLTPDEKEFVIKHAFNLGSAKTDPMSPQMMVSPSNFTPSPAIQPAPSFQASPLTKLPQIPMNVRPNPMKIDGYYSSGTGGNNYHLKGGFGDVSIAHTGPYRPVLTPGGPQSMMPSAGHSFFYMAQLQQANMQQMQNMGLNPMPQFSISRHPDLM